MPEETLSAVVRALSRLEDDIAAGRIRVYRSLLDVPYVHPEAWRGLHRRIWTTDG